MAEDEDEEPEKTPKKWKKQEGRWRSSTGEESEEAADEGSRYLELPSGEVVREPLGPGEVPEPEPEPEPEPAEAEEGSGGLLGGLRGRRSEEEPEPEGEPPEGEVEEDGGGAGRIVAAVVVVLLLLVVLLVAAAALDIADPLGLGDTLLGQLGSDTTGGTTNGGTTPDGDDGMGGNETPPTVLFDVEWVVDSNDISRSGYTGEGNTSTEAIEIARTNLTWANLTFSWDDSTNDTAAGDDTNRPDEFNVTLISPSGQEIKKNGTDGDNPRGFINISMQLAPVPTSPTSVEAVDMQNATEAVLQAQPEDTTHTGTWTVVVEMVDAGDVVSATLGGTGPTQTVRQDEGNNWDFTLHIEWYEAFIRQV